MKVFNESQPKERTHSVSHRGLQRSVLFGLAADVVEGEEQVVVVSQIGRNLHLHLLIELRRPSEQKLNKIFRKRRKAGPTEAEGQQVREPYLLW